jgi:hypothetical protein
VAPRLPRPGLRLLRCPICRLGLDARAGALACPNRHSFDLAREGYVNLLPGSRRRPADGGDHAEQLRHRRAFLDAGHFDFISREIAETARVLRPGGWLALVYPETNHLIELRHRYRLLGQRSQKGRRYRKAVSRMIGPAAVTRIVRRAVLAPDAVRDIVLMGPNARHPAGSMPPSKAGPIAVTFDIGVLLTRKAEIRNRPAAAQ